MSFQVLTRASIGQSVCHTVTAFARLGTNILMTTPTRKDPNPFTDVSRLVLKGKTSFLNTPFSEV